MNRTTGPQNPIRVARASRVLANASRVHGVFGRIAQLQCMGKTDGEIVLPRRQNQHARRARYAGKANRALRLDGVYTTRAAIIRGTA